MSEAKKTDEDGFEPLQHMAVLGGNPPMIVEVCSYWSAKAIIEDLKDDRDALLAALKMHQECHRSNWDTQGTCYICDVTRKAIEQAESH